MASKASKKTCMEADIFQVLTIRFHRDETVENLMINAVMKSTIQGLKAEIMDQINVDVAQQAWYLNRQVMENEKHLSNYVSYDDNYTDQDPLQIDVYQTTQ